MFFLAVLAKIQLENEGNVLRSIESYCVQVFGSLIFWVALIVDIVPVEVFGEQCEENNERRN